MSHWDQLVVWQELELELVLVLEPISGAIKIEMAALRQRAHRIGIEWNSSNSSIAGHCISCVQINCPR